MNDATSKELSFKTVLAECPECKTRMRLSFDKDENERYTYCARCDKAVMWKEVITWSPSEFKKVKIVPDATGVDYSTELKFSATYKCDHNGIIFCEKLEKASEIGYPACGSIKVSRIAKFKEDENK